MSKKSNKNKTKPAVLFDPATDEPDKTVVVGVSVEYEADPEKPNTEESVMTAKIETITEVSPKVKALMEFAELWKSLPHHNYMSAKQARAVHRLWQTVTGRTDYYVNCSVCTIAHIKILKKEAKNEGIVIE